MASEKLEKQQYQVVIKKAWQTPTLTTLQPEQTEGKNPASGSEVSGYSPS